MKADSCKIKNIMTDLQKKSYINKNKKEESFIDIENQNPLNDNEKKEIDKFLTLDEINSEKFLINIEDGKLSIHQKNISKARKKRSQYLGRKRNYSIFKKSNNNLNSNLENDRFSKKKTKNLSKNLRKNYHACPKNRENFIQIINIFPVSESISNYSEKSNSQKEDNNILDIKELNKSWVNWINEVMSKNNSQSDNESIKSEDKRSQISINIKDLNAFSFGNSIHNSKNSEKERNLNNDIENFVDILCDKDNDKYLTIPNYDYLNDSYQNEKKERSKIVNTK